MVKRSTTATGNQAWGLSAPRPAPGDLRILQDLVDTRDGATGVDTLATPAVAADWLASHALIAADLELSAADHARFVEFRDSLRAVLAAGERPDMAIIERLNRSARGARPEIRLGPDGAPPRGYFDRRPRPYPRPVHGHRHQQLHRRPLGPPQDMRQPRLPRRLLRQFQDPCPPLVHPALRRRGTVAEISPEREVQESPAVDL